MEVLVSTSRTPRTGVRRGMMVCAVIVVALFSAAATALAGADHWFSGTLVHGYGYASTEAHSISYIEATGDHNGFCVAKDTGTTGYASATKTTAGSRTCSSSGGFAARVENSACCYHGWVDNSTGNDIIFDVSTHYSY
jgi:hypothetical protein